MAHMTEIVLVFQFIQAEYIWYLELCETVTLILTIYAFNELMPNCLSRKQFYSNVQGGIWARRIPSSLWYKGNYMADTLIDHSDVVGASPVSAAATTSSFSI